jgi:hypothetical protein
VALIELVENVGHGVVTLSSVGAFTYTPEVGYVGEDRFTYRITVGQLSSVAEVIIRIINVSPTVLNAQFTLPSRDPFSATLLSFASDPDDEDSLTFSIGTQPQFGIVAMEADGDFVYTPGTDFDGEDEFFYIAADGAAEKQAKVKISTANHAPVALNYTYRIDKDTWLEGAENALTKRAAYDVDGDVLTFEEKSRPTNHETFTINLDGSFVYQPKAGFTGTDTFKYRVTDPLGKESEIATITIIVGTGTFLRDDAYPLPANGPLIVHATWGVLRNDTYEGDVDAEIVTPPSKGLLTLDRAGNFKYTPDPLAPVSGVIEFTYEVRRRSSLTAEPGKAKVRLFAPDSAPKLTLLRERFSGPGVVAIRRDVGGGTYHQGWDRNQDQIQPFALIADRNARYTITLKVERPELLDAEHLQLLAKSNQLRPETKYDATEILSGSSLGQTPNIVLDTTKGEMIVTFEQMGVRPNLGNFDSVTQDWTLVPQWALPTETEKHIGVVGTAEHKIYVLNAPAKGKEMEVYMRHTVVRTASLAARVAMKWVDRKINRHFAEYDLVAVWQANAPSLTLAQYVTRWRNLERFYRMTKYDFADELKQAMVDVFASCNILRADDGKLLTYYGSVESPAKRETIQLIGSSAGQCGAWADFFLDCLRVQGVEAAALTSKVIIIPGSDKNFMFVKNWAGPRVPPGTAPGPFTISLPLNKSPYRWVPAQGGLVAHWEYNFKAADGRGDSPLVVSGPIKHQGYLRPGSNPRAVFNDHVVAEIEMYGWRCWVDASYGTFYRTPLKDIDGFPRTETAIQHALLEQFQQRSLDYCGFADLNIFTGIPRTPLRILPSTTVPYSDFVIKYTK